MTTARIVARPADLALLELALGGAPVRLTLRESVGADEVEFTDAENTPVASARLDGLDLVDVAPLRPLALGSGPAADPARRRPAREVRDVTEWDALLLDELPTRADLERLRVAGGLVVVPAIAPVPRGAVSADAIVSALGDLDALVVPAPGTAPGVLSWGTELEELPLLYGARSVTRVAELREADEERAYDEAARRELDRIERLAHVPAGVVVLFTGLSGSGKSTIAKALATDLEATSDRVTSLLDGDEVRQMLSAGLGFDRAGRDLNVRRIGYVASLVAKHAGIAIAAPIAPFDAVRQEVRAMAEDVGRFLLVHVSTPLEVCEARDRKGLYAAARRGEVADFTGISSPYEEPADADLVIDASVVPVPDAVALVRAALAGITPL